MKTQQSPEISYNETCIPLSGSQIDVAVLLIPYLQVVLTMSKYVHKYDSKMTQEWMAVSEWNSTAVSLAFNRVACWLLMNDKLAISGTYCIKMCSYLNKMKHIKMHRHPYMIRWESTMSAGSRAHIVIGSQGDSARCEYNPYSGFILRSSDYIKNPAGYSFSRWSWTYGCSFWSMPFIYLAWNPPPQLVAPRQITRMTLSSAEINSVLAGHPDHLWSSYTCHVSSQFISMKLWHFTTVVHVPAVHQFCTWNEIMQREKFEHSFFK